MAKSTVTDCRQHGAKKHRSGQRSQDQYFCCHRGLSPAILLKPTLRGDLIKNKSAHRRPQSNVCFCSYNASHPDLRKTNFGFALGHFAGPGKGVREISGSWFDQTLLIFSTLGNPEDIYSHKLSQNRNGKVPGTAVIVVNWVKLSGSFSPTHSLRDCRKKGQRCSAVLHWAPGGSVVQAFLFFFSACSPVL